MDYQQATARAAGQGNLIWHYTSLDTLRLILESNVLLATEVAFQNDISETQTADAAIESVLTSFDDDPELRAFANDARSVLGDIDGGVVDGFSEESGLLNSSRFIICASQEPDSLYAWRTYAAGGIGCAIGLDPEVPLGPVGAGRGRDSQTDGWLPVIYDRDEYERLAQDELGALAIRWKARNRGEFAARDHYLNYDELPRIRALIRARAKQAAFSDEHEHRLTLSGGVRPEMVTTTPSMMGPRPHLRVAVSRSWGQGVSEAATAPKLPIRAVRLGPSAPPIALSSLRWLLVANGYAIDAAGAEWDDDGHFAAEDWSSSVMLAKSDHPFRTT